MSDPIDQLLAEHRTLLAGFGALRQAVKTLEARGDAALPEALPTLRSVGQMMATQLLQHARKEDEALFPALERVLGAAGPTGVMRSEHLDIHRRAALFRETLHQLNEVEHPAIVAGGESLRAQLDRGAGAQQLCQTSETLLSLVEAHFYKEEAILFPMARELLTPQVLREVGEQMEALAPPGA